MSPPAPWQPPAQFEEYRLVRPLGSGAMGQVYLAHDTLLDRPVAVKFIASVAPDEAQRERFRTEARAIARVQHPNVVSIHRVGEVQRHPYLVSEFVRGESLERLPRPMPWQRVLDLGIGLARGLAAAHRRGVLHRDIKPANAMLTEEGEVKLLDFGVAKLLGATVALAELQPAAAPPAPHRAEPAPAALGATVDLPPSTEPAPAALVATVDLPQADSQPSPAAASPAGTPSPRASASATGPIGTPYYMAPELWRGEPGTALSDIYSLGVLLYELCSGTLPHLGSTLHMLRESVQSQPAVPLAQVAPEVDPALAAILERCLAREPAERFPSAEALREALEALQESTREEFSPGLADEAPASQGAVWRQRLRRVATVLMLPLCAAAMYGGFELRARLAREREVAQALAAAEQLVAQARTQGEQEQALRREALATFDAGRRTKAESLWARTLEAAAEQERTYGETARLLDKALARDSRHPAVRHLLAESLYEHLLLAERYRRPPEQLTELRRRLEQMDDTGEYRGRLEAPALLDLESIPSGAEVLLERAVDEGGKLRWSDPRRLGVTPLSGVPLPAGSYRLTLQRPERPRVYYPVLLGRGERHRVRLELPASVPEGYVYVPPGRFLFGSSAEESTRRQDLAQPLHEVETQGFLIGRTEVTFAEWLAFLRTLPSKERGELRPGGINQFGRLELLERADGAWELQIERPGHTYRVREGQRLRYLERAHRAEQDWLRFPVSGISWEQAQAYLAWLDRTGRLRGARLCEKHEWERAARGADGRDFPHGSRLEPDDANYDETYGRKSLAFGPDEVGSHPASDSPFGVADLAGNVWEWMSSATSPNAAIYGGGSFYQEHVAARSTNHGGGETRMRTPHIGLRVCAPPPRP